MVSSYGSGILDKIVRMSSLIGVFAGHLCHVVRFVMKLFDHLDLHRSHQALIECSVMLFENSGLSACESRNTIDNTKGFPTLFLLYNARYIDEKEPIREKLLFPSPIRSRKGAYQLKTTLAIDSDIKRWVY